MEDIVEHRLTERSDQGLLRVYKPSEAEPACMIVAIHDISGHRSHSWTTSNGVFWLSDLLPHDLPDSCILTYGHNGGPEAAANALLWDLIDTRIQNRWACPVILLGHGAGGTVSKQLFVISSPIRSSRPAVNELHKAIKAFVFFGTMHRGEHTRGLQISANIVGSMMSWISSSVAQTAESANKYFAQYQRINIDFARNGGEDFPMVCFYETIKSNGVGILVPQEFATIEADWVENRPLNANYTDLTKYARSHNPNYIRVITAIQNLHDEVLGLKCSPAPALRLNDVSDEPSVATTANIEPGVTAGLRVLALDGGGIRGLFGIIVLQSIMEEVRKIDCPKSDDPLKPCDYFDLIGGTSTGGLLGIMLGRLRMDLVSCKEAYKSLSESIFKRDWWYFPGKGTIDALRGAPWYSGEALESAVKGILSERISQQERNELIGRGHSAAEAMMKGFGRSSTKTFVCAVVDKSDICERLRTYDTRGNGRAAPCTIWQACRATSAASLYFPSIKINDRTYWDGGMNSNNPILQVIQEVRSEYSEDIPFEAIVSIGTGKSPKVDPGSHVFSVIKYAIKEMTNTEKKHAEFVSSYPDLVGQYFRFNEEENLHKIDLADWKQLPRVEEMANNYVTSTQGRQYILACAKKLARRRGDINGG